MFALARNNPLFNNLQPHVDVSPCADQQVVLFYVSKYCTKAETETVKLDDIES